MSKNVQNGMEKIFSLYLIMTMSTAIFFMLKEYIHVSYFVFILGGGTDFGAIPMHIKILLALGCPVFLSLFFYLFSVSNYFLKTLSVRPIRMGHFYFLHRPQTK